MTLYLNDLLTIVNEMGRLQLDQVESLAEGSTDEDDYNHNAVREIVRVLEHIQNRFGDDVVDLWGDIANAEALLEVDA
jgi:hypothetical protein